MGAEHGKGQKQEQMQKQRQKQRQGQVSVCFSSSGFRGFFCLWAACQFSELLRLETSRRSLVETGEST